MRAPFLLGSILIAAALVPSFSTTRAIDTAEVGRIQAHIARAEAFAARRDLSHLTPAQRAARAREFARLEEYRRRGEFPENRVRRERTPVFVDSRGVHCAVGHLLALDGETALVTRIASTRNCARVRELADEPGLVAWLDRHGLTLEEAARIQPTYDGGGGLIGEGSTVTRNDAYPTVAVFSTVLSATGVLVNVERGDTPASRSARVIYGSIVGATGICVGVAGFGGGRSDGLGLLAGGAGLLSILSTVHNAPRHAKPSAPLVSWSPRWQGGSRIAFVNAVF